MADNDRMPKVDMSKEFSKLKQSDKYFVKKLERMNTDRVQTIRSLKKKNMAIGLALGVGVLGIYFYTMYAVKQEKFLDFEHVPEKTSSVTS